MKLPLVYSCLLHAALVLIASYFLTESPLLRLSRKVPVELNLLESISVKTQSNRSQPHPIRVTQKFSKKPISESVEKLSLPSIPAPKGEGRYSTSCLQNIQNQIRSSLEYPLSFRRRGIQGQVILRFEANDLGRVEKIEVSKSSGHLELDRLAVVAVQKAAPFSCLRAEEKKMGKFSLNLPIDFTIAE